MDIYSAAHKLQIHSSGIKFKKEFKVFTDVPRLFALTEAPPDFQEIRDKLALLCADNYEEFSHPKPLWKNPEFFVQLSSSLMKMSILQRPLILVCLQLTFCWLEKNATNY